MPHAFAMSVFTGSLALDFKMDGASSSTEDFFGSDTLFLLRVPAGTSDILDKWLSSVGVGDGLAIGAGLRNNVSSQACGDDTQMFSSSQSSNTVSTLNGCSYAFNFAGKYQKTKYISRHNIRVYTANVSIYTDTLHVTPHILLSHLT